MTDATPPPEIAPKAAKPPRFHGVMTIVGVVAIGCVLWLAAVSAIGIYVDERQPESLDIVIWVAAMLLAVIIAGVAVHLLLLTSPKGILARISALCGWLVMFGGMCTAVRVDPAEGRALLEALGTSAYDQCLVANADLPRAWTAQARSWDYAGIDVESVAMSALLRVCGKYPQKQPGEMRRIFFEAAKNRAIDELKKQQRYEARKGQLMVGCLVEEAPEAELPSASEVHRAMVAVEAMVDPVDWCVFHRHYVLGQTIRASAEACGLTRSTGDRNARRVLNHLQSWFAVECDF
jgi:DNA-directed RNA polymerase specialized sigma24 family protein